MKSCLANVTRGNLTPANSFPLVFRTTSDLTSIAYMDHSHPIPIQQLRADERNLFDSAHPAYALRANGSPTLRVALVYPNDYAIGMSSLGYQITYRTINEHPSARAERFFMDTLKEGSIESGDPLSNFDIIAFSATYEMDDPNILDAIEMAGAPILAHERNRTRTHPLILIGGVLVSVNRLPLFPFADAFIHGDAEAVLPPILDALSNGPNPPIHDIRERLAAIQNLPGVEVTPAALTAAGLPSSLDHEAYLRPLSIAEARQTEPICPTPPHSVVHENLNNSLCSTQILTPHTEFSDMVLVDLARGCPHHCTFCWIGHNTPPYRQRTIETLIKAIEPWTAHTDRFGLVSSAVGAHTEIDELCRWLMSRNLRVSYSSLRVEEVSQTMLEAVARGGQKSITIAPEAGNTRVRRLLGKRITDEEILDVTARAMDLGIENIKQYFMIGVPSETDEEALDIARFTERVREVMLRYARPRGRMGQLAINLGIFVPKPNLPLNHIEPSPLAAVKKRLKKVVQRLGRVPNLQVNVSSPDLAAAQTVLSVGGVESAAYLITLRECAGDWRKANRNWSECADQDYRHRLGLSRTSADSIRSRTGAARVA